MPVGVATINTDRSNPPRRWSSARASSARPAIVSADRHPAYTRIGSAAGVPLNSPISDAVGPEVRNTFPCRPIESQPIRDPLPANDGGSPASPSNVASHRAKNPSAARSAAATTTSLVTNDTPAATKPPAITTATRRGMTRSSRRDTRRPVPIMPRTIVTTTHATATAIANVRIGYADSIGSMFINVRIEFCQAVICVSDAAPNAPATVADAMRMTASRRSSGSRQPK